MRSRAVAPGRAAEGSLAIDLETFLARLYVDDDFRSRFLADPRQEALRAGLSEDDAAALERIDREGLRLAADSFARKRRR